MSKEAYISIQLVTCTTPTLLRYTSFFSEHTYTTHQIALNRASMLYLSFHGIMKMSPGTLAAMCPPKHWIKYARGRRLVYVYV